MDRDKIIRDALKNHFKGVEQRLDLLSMRVLADSDKWITVKPNGPEHEGRPVLLGEGGEIKGGMGGKFNGKNIGEARKSTAKGEPHKELTEDDRQKILKSNAAFSKWTQGKEGGGSRGEFKQLVRSGQLDHLYDISVEEKGQLDQEAKDRATATKEKKQAKNEAWRARNVPKMAAEKQKRAEKLKQENIEIEKLREAMRTKPKPAQETNQAIKPTEVQKKSGLPTTGRVSNDDPSIYGSWLFGHEGELWSDIRHLAPETPQQKQETLIEKAKRAGVKGIREGMKESVIEKKLKIHEIGNKGARYIKAGKESGLPQYEGITDKNAKDFSEIIGEHPYSLDTRAWTVDVRGLKKNVESLVSSGLMEPSETGYKHKLTPVGRELAKHIITS